MPAISLRALILRCDTIPIERVAGGDVVWVACLGFGLWPVWPMGRAWRGEMLCCLNMLLEGHKWLFNPMQAPRCLLLP